MQSMHPINCGSCTVSDMARVHARHVSCVDGRHGMQSSEAIKPGRRRMSKSVLHWQKKLARSDRPAYLLMAELIAEDVRSGRLVARDRLPSLSPA